MEPSLQFVDEPVYIRDIIERFHNCNIESESEDSTQCVMSIDIGILHLGISVAILDKEYNLIEIIWIDLINITEFSHGRYVSEEKCKLFHTKSFCDWLDHVYQENSDFFEMADYILIERQPPIGLVAIEQLIFSRWRHKAILISPNSMHKHFNIGHYDYDNRKKATEKIANKFLTNNDLVEQLTYYNRIHDITDSICLMIFWINKKQKEYTYKMRKKMIMESKIQLSVDMKKMTINDWFDKHKLTI